MTASLAYRKNEAAILRGDVPEKYTRLLPYIPGDKILEIGSAEGVLALCLAREDMGAKKEVVGVERQESRFWSAMTLARDWEREFKFTCHPCFVQGSAEDNLPLFYGTDTLVSVRMIYYLGDALDDVFAEAAKHIPNVVLCGNGNRAQRWRQGIREETKADNYYASREGMVDLLTRHGYRIETVVPDGDEIVVGKKT